MNGAALGALDHAKSDGVALRLLEDHLRNAKKRVSPAGHFDLAGQRLDSLFIGHQADIQFRKRLRRFAMFAPLVRLAAIRTAVRAASFAARSPVTRASVARGRSTVSAPAASLSLSAARATPLRPSTAIGAPIETPLLPAFVLGILLS